MPTDDALIDDLAKAIYEAIQPDNPWKTAHDISRSIAMERARYALRALQTHPRWRVVPVDDTSDMFAAGAKTMRSYEAPPSDIWAAMLAAAPKPVGE